MESTTRDFKANVDRALADAMIQKAMGNVKRGFIEKRRKATARMPGCAMAPPGASLGAVAALTT